MAEVQKQPRGIIQVADASGSVGYLNVHLRQGVAAASGLAALRGLAAAAPTSCAPWLVQVRYEVEELEPEDGAGNIHPTAVFIFRTSTAGQLGILAVPGVLPALVSAEDPTAIDLTAPPVAALVAELTSGKYCTPFGYILTECVAGLLELRET